MIKRVTDICLSVLGLCVLWPLFLVVSVLIKLDSRGAIFYRGVRTGLHGRPFRIFKFRSMVENGEMLGGPTTGKNDPRVTRVGRCLRKYKLDELPQLLNVLLGDMSFVGPRPEVLQCTQMYTGEEKLILSVRPGITDLASIHFRRLDEVVGEHDPHGFYEKNVLPIKNALRVKYVKERTYLGDIRLICTTVCRLLLDRRS